MNEKLGILKKAARHARNVSFDDGIYVTLVVDTIGVVIKGRCHFDDGTTVSCGHLVTWMDIDQAVTDQLVPAIDSVMEQMKAEVKGRRK